MKMQPMAALQNELRQVRQNAMNWQKEARKLLKELTGSLQVQQYLLLTLANGEITIPAAELVKMEGRIQVMRDKEADTYTLVALQPEEPETTEDGEGEGVQRNDQAHVDSAHAAGSEDAGRGAGERGGEEGSS